MTRAMGCSCSCQGKDRQNFIVIVFTGGGFCQVCTGECVFDVQLSSSLVDDVDVVALELQEHSLKSCGGCVEWLLLDGDQWLMVGFHCGVFPKDVAVEL